MFIYFTVTRSISRTKPISRAAWGYMKLYLWSRVYLYFNQLNCGKVLHDILNALRRAEDTYKARDKINWEQNTFAPISAWKRLSWVKDPVFVWCIDQSPRWCSTFPVLHEIKLFDRNIMWPMPFTWVSFKYIKGVWLDLKKILHF